MTDLAELQIAVDTTQVNAAGASLDRLGQRANQATRNVGLHSQAWTHLGFQLNDAVTMLASGSSAFQVLATQGGQVYQSLATHQQGWLAGLRQVMSGVAGMINPTRVLLGAAVAVPATLIAAAQSARAANSEIARSLTATSRAYGITVDTVNQASDAMSNFNGIGVGAARDIATAMANTGNVSAQSLEPAIGITQRYAKMLAQDLPDATADLAAALRNPGKGIDDLNDKMNLADGATTALIKSLAASGDAGSAAAMILNLIAQRSEEAGNRVSRLSALWDGFTNAIVQDFNRLGQGMDHLINPTAEDELDRATGKLQYLRSELESYQRTGGGKSAVAYSIGRQIDDQEKVVDKLKEVLDLEKRRSHEIDERRRRDMETRAATDMTKQVLPGATTVTDLTSQLTVMQKGMENAGNLKDWEATAEAIKRHKQALQDNLIAGSAWELQARKQATANELQLQAVNAVTVGERARIANATVMNTALGSQVGMEERLAQARFASQMVSAQWIAQVDQSVIAMENETSALISVTDQVNRRAISSGQSSAALQREIQLSQMMTDAMSLEGAEREKAIEAVERYRRALDQQAEAQANLQVTSGVAAQRDQLSVLEAQISTIGYNSAARSELIAIMQAEYQLMAMGANMRSQESQQYIANAAAIARMTEELREQEAAYKRNIELQRRQQQFLQQGNRSFQQQIQMYQLEIDMIGESDSERESALAGLRAEHDLINQGISLHSQQAQAYIESARAAAEWGVAAQNAASKAAAGAGGFSSNMGVNPSGQGNQTMTLGGGSGGRESWDAQYGPGGYNVRTGGGGFGRSSAFGSRIQTWAEPTAQGLAYQDASRKQQEYQDSGMDGLDSVFRSVMSSLESAAKGPGNEPKKPTARPGATADIAAPSAYGADKNASYFYDPNSRQGFLEQFGINFSGIKSEEQKAYEVELRQWQEAKKASQIAERQLAQLTQIYNTAKEQLMTGMDPGPIAEALRGALAGLTGVGGEAVKKATSTDDMTLTDAYSVGQGTSTGTASASLGGGGHIGLPPKRKTSISHIGAFAGGGEFEMGGRPGRDANRVSMDLTRGENVKITKPGSKSDRPIAFNMTVVTQDANSFRESRSQIQGRVVKMVSSALEKA